MQDFSNTYRVIYNRGKYTADVRISINGVTYDQDSIFSASSDCKIFDGEPTIGGVYSSTFDFSLLGDGASIPKMATVIPYFRIRDEYATSEWIKKGVFFIDTRSVTHNDSGITVFEAQCFDAMLKANANYSTTSLQWPAVDTDVVHDIAIAMGVSVDPRNASIMTGGYMIPLPTNYTRRDVLSFIASMYAANFIISDDGKLRIVPLDGVFTTLDIGKSCANFNISPKRQPYTQVVYEVDENTAIVSGSTDTKVMEVYNPIGTQAAADAAYSILSAFEYQPFSASSVWSNPILELGDRAIAVGEYIVIYSRKLNFGAGMVMDLSAPNDNYIDHEYQYKSPEDRRYERTISGMSSQISINAAGVSILSGKIDNIGGRNLLLQSLTKHYTRSGTGTTATFTDNVSVAEWACDNAIQATGTRGATAVFGVLRGISADTETSIDGMKYAFSVYVKNVGTNTIYVSGNISGSGNETVEPGEAKRVVRYATGNGVNDAQIVFSLSTTTSSGDPYDLIYWHPKIEYGEVVTDWTPAPEDKVGTDEIISMINVSPEQIQIDSDKISLAGKTIDLTSDTISITSNSFSVTPAGIITATGVDLSGTFNMTDGSINITTATDTTDAIELNYSTRALRLSPTRVELRDTNGAFGNYAIALRHDFGAIGAYDSVNTSTTYYSIAAHTGTFSLRGKTTPGAIDLQDTSGNNTVILSGGNGYGGISKVGLVMGDGTHKLADLDTTALTFYNSSGTVTASYPADGTYLKSVSTTAANYTLSSSGYASVTKPAELSGKKIVSADVYSYTSATGAFAVSGYNSRPQTAYIFGTPNATITDLIIQFWYIGV